MKYLFLLLSCGIVFSASAQNANTPITEGAITYTFKTNGDAHPQAEIMYPSARIKIFFKDDKMKVYNDMVMMRYTLLTDASDKAGSMVMDLAGTKKAAYITKKDFKELTKERSNRKYEIEFSDSTKMIQGYECKLAIVKLGTTVQYVFYAPDIQPVNRFTDLNYEEIPGFLLEIVSFQGIGIITMTAQVIDTSPLADDIFQQEIGEEYELITFQELKNPIDAELKKKQ